MKQFNVKNWSLFNFATCFSPLPHEIEGQKKAWFPSFQDTNCVLERLLFKPFAPLSSFVNPPDSANFANVLARHEPPS